MRGWGFPRKGGESGQKKETSELQWGKNRPPHARRGVPYVTRAGKGIWASQEKLHRKRWGDEDKGNRERQNSSSRKTTKSGETKKKKKGVDGIPFGSSIKGNGDRKSITKEKPSCPVRNRGNEVKKKEKKEGAHVVSYLITHPKKSRTPEM